MARRSDAAGAVATIDVVAREAGVSVRTVSRVINDSVKVGKSTRASVQAVIDRLGFKASMRGRALASGRSFLLGVVQDDPNAHVIGALQRGIVEVCSHHGYELLVHPAQSASPQLTDDLSDFVRRTHVDGLILLPPISENPAIPIALAALGVPAVGIASVRVPAYPAMLVTEEREAAGLVGEHLIALGHERIGMITGPLAFYSSTEREQGFRASLHRHGLQLPRRYVAEGDYSFDSGIAAANALLSLDEPPTAIFASNDIMAAAVMKVAAARGLAVPGQLSIAGFDDSDIAAMVSPAMTTVRRPLIAIAREATECLLELIAGGADERLTDHRIVLTLIERQSTAASEGDRTSGAAPGCGEASRR